MLFRSLVARQLKPKLADLLNLAWHNPSRIPDSTRNLYEKPLRVQGWDNALWQLTASSQSPGLEKKLGNLTLPILVITGDDDRIVPTKASIQLAGQLPNAKLAVIQNAGHVPHEEQPEAFMKAVNDFIFSLHL